MESLGLPAWITRKKRDIEMNLQILRWLLAHKDLLLQVVEIVKGWSKELPLVEQWAIVDKVARLVLPLLNEQDVVHLTAQDWDSDDPVSAFAFGAEVQSLGFDWAVIIQVIIPILQVILQALSKQQADD